MKKHLQIFLCLLSAHAHSQTYDSLDLKIGQMIMIGMKSNAPDWRVMDDIHKNKAGALIFFEKNIPTKDSYVALKKMIWNYQKVARIPLFICIDQEGGYVNRLKPKYGFPRTLSNRAMGKAPTADSVSFYGEITAATLAGLGFNVNFAPVVDLQINPLNPVIAKAERAFSADVDTVTMMASAFITAHRKMRVHTALKHFPGHGSSATDTHIDFTDVTDTWTEQELEPYKRLLLANKTDAVMTSHIVNRKLDNQGYPGTLSKKIIQGLLRGKLKYDGVVFSDDMQMQAISRYYDFEESIVLSINAGVDVLCFSNNISGSQNRTVDIVHAAIKKAVQKGDISQDRIDESFRRIMRMKKHLMPRADYRFDDIEEDKKPAPALTPPPPLTRKERRAQRKQERKKEKETKRQAKKAKEENR